MVFLIPIILVGTWESAVESDSSRIRIHPLTNGIASQERKNKHKFHVHIMSLITFKERQSILILLTDYGHKEYAYTLTYVA